MKESVKVPAFSEVKHWAPAVETSIVQAWKDAELFTFDAKTKKKIYSIDTPPPYVNAPIHIGHALTYSYMDFFARYKRMKGFEVLFPLGMDRNGLPIETAAEKKYNVSPFSVPREEFIRLCEQLLREASEESSDTFAHLGISFSSYKKGDSLGSVYETDSPAYRAITQATFIELYKKGLVYEDTRINNWDPKLRTTIADSEIDYKDLQSVFVDVQWKVKETGEPLVIATTRPELICTCGMVIYHPDDKRYSHLAGKTALSPLFGKEVPIKAHPLANPEKGSGVVMMCSAGDLSDIQFFREMGLKPVIAIGIDGKMNEHAGQLQGLKVREARKKMIELLKEENLIVKEVEILHRTPVSERSGAEVEFIAMPEFYLQQVAFKKDLERVIDKMHFYPPESRAILDAWIESVSIDWPISRRRFYATPIPLWHAEEKRKSLVAVPPVGIYYQPWKESPPKDALVYSQGKKIGSVKDFSVSWRGEERVFDTWMDSSISELVMLQYTEDPSFFKKAFPASLRPQGKEIIRTWLYYTVLRSYLELKKAPFEDVWIHQHIVDAQGRKMSKSLGNGIDPQELLREYGAEAMRFWASIEGDLAKQDLKCSKEKIAAELKTMNKLLNVARFVFLFERPTKKPKLNALDELFVNYMDDLTIRTDASYAAYDFYHPAVELRRFLWEIFASHYLELVKSRAYNKENLFSAGESESARWTLYYLLERFLHLAYPIIPQITSVIGTEMKLDLLHREFPSVRKKKFDARALDALMEFNGAVWKAKKEAGVSLRESFSGIGIPKELEDFSSDLRACHALT